MGKKTKEQARKAGKRSVIQPTSGIWKYVCEKKRGRAKQDNEEKGWKELNEKKKDKQKKGETRIKKKTGDVKDKRKREKI